MHSLLRSESNPDRTCAVHLCMCISPLQVCRAPWGVCTLCVVPDLLGTRSNLYSHPVGVFGILSCHLFSNNKRTLGLGCASWKYATFLTWADQWTDFQGKLALWRSRFPAHVSSLHFGNLRRVASCFAFRGHVRVLLVCFLLTCGMESRARYSHGFTVSSRSCPRWRLVSRVLSELPRRRHPCWRPP